MVPISRLHSCPFSLFQILIQLIAKGLLSVAEETQSGILREYSDANIPTFQRDDEGGSIEKLDLDIDKDGQPDFTPQPSFSSQSQGKVSNSVVNEFWKMVISIFFLTWMKKGAQNKKLENGKKSTSSSVDSESVPIMSFSPEREK
jgi:hypothetical protein